MGEAKFGVYVKLKVGVYGELKIRNYGEAQSKVYTSKAEQPCNHLEAYKLQNRQFWLVKLKILDGKTGGFCR